MNELDIYRRLKWISKLMKEDKSFNQLNCFFVGYEYDFNTNNLSKGDARSSKFIAPKYFYSQKWDDLKNSSNNIVGDYPAMVIFPPDEVKVDDWSTYSIQGMILDTMHSGKTKSEREQEDIWSSCSTIFSKVLKAFEDKSVDSLINQVVFADLFRTFGFPSIPIAPDPNVSYNRADWNADDENTYIDWMTGKEKFEVGYGHRINFMVENVGALTRHIEKANTRLAGIAFSFDASVVSDNKCIEYNSELPEC